jgi:hypothetical protein
MEIESKGEGVCQIKNEEADEPDPMHLVTGQLPTKSRLPQAPTTVKVESMPLRFVSFRFGFDAGHHGAKR